MNKDPIQSDLERFRHANEIDQIINIRSKFFPEKNKLSPTKRAAAVAAIAGFLVIAGSTPTEQESVLANAENISTPERVPQALLHPNLDLRVDAEQSVEKFYQEYLDHHTSRFVDQIIPLYEDMPHIRLDIVPYIDEDPELLYTIISIDAEKIEQLPESVLESVYESIVKVNVTDSVMNLRSASGFTIRSDSGGLEVITAGHVVDISDQPMLTLHNNDGIKISSQSEPKISFGNNFEQAKDENGEQVTVDRTEDLAIISYQPNESLPLKPLEVRNFDDEPLVLGELLYAVNFQGDIPVGDPKVIPIVYNGDIFSRQNFVEVITDIDIDEEDDDIEPGASGGVVVDMQGKVVGTSVSTYEDHKDGTRHRECLASYWQDSTRNGLNQINTPLKVRYVLNFENTAECNRGLSGAWLRVPEDGQFIING